MRVLFSRRSIAILFAFMIIFSFAGALYAQGTATSGTRTVSRETALGQAIPIPFVSVNAREAENPEEVSLGLQLIFLLAILTLAPSIVIMTTSFVRVSIVLSFIQRALSLQEVPPRQVIMGLSLFLTFFIMQPTLTTLTESSLTPFLEGEITAPQFYERSEVPIRKFMLQSMDSEQGLNSIDLFLFVSKQGQISQVLAGKTIDELAADTESLSTAVLIPAFLVNELTIAFVMGIYLFIPFIVIDLIVASSLMSMGMIMLPPVMVSLPLKILLFIAVDGWKLIALRLVESYV